MNPFCWYCNIYTQNEPDHWNKEGECLEQLRDQAEYRAEFWRELESIDWNIQAHYGDAINKEYREGRMTPNQRARDISLSKWRE